MDYVRLHTAARERERERETEENIHNLEITVAAAKLLNYNCVFTSSTNTKPTAKKKE